MKRTFRNKVALSLAVLSMTYACSDSFLEIPPVGSLNEQLLATGPGLEASLIAVYSQVNGRANRMGSPSNWVWGSIRGGEANKGTDPGDFSDINPIQRFEYQSTQQVILDKYNANYEGVARANGVLRILKLAPNETTAQKAQNLQIEAQVKFLRAHFYFELARAYDKTPFVDENLDVAGSSVPAGADLVKNDKVLWPLIEADMQFAYTNLPETQSQVGRVNKWAAASYLAKIYMYQQKFTDAKTLFDLIIPTAYGGPGAGGKTSNGKTYGLVPLYANIFKASNDNNEESIWAYQAAANTGSVNNANPEFDLNWPYNTGADGPGNCCSFFQPTFEMANSFRTVGGLPLLDDGAGTYAPAYNLPANEVKTDMGLESADAFTPDAGELDPRIDHSIGRRGIPYLDWQDMPGKAWIRNQPNAGPYQTKKYAYYKSDKGSLQDNSSWTPGYTAINYTIIRFADILLMAAEAEIEVGSPAKAREYVNYVRARAANPAGFVMKSGNPAADYVISQYADTWAKDDATREKVRFERKLELSGEGHRYFDLMRWSGMYTADPSDDNDYIDRVINAYLTYEAPKIPSGAFTDSEFNLGKDEWLPIPQSQLDLTPGVLTQNPGY
jgi:starch-binding outer membrane protein, SusD/RagB family